MSLEIHRLATEFGWTHKEWTKSPAGDFALISQPASNRESVFTDSQWKWMDSHLDHSWWYRTRNLIIRDVLQRRNIRSCIWDVGCGSGVVSSFLIREGFSVIGVEPSLTGATMAVARGVVTFNSDLQSLCLPPESLNAVAMFDVLEHLDNRDAALREIYRILKPGAHLVLTIPALMMLWSEMDDRGHEVRYRKKTIRRELKRNGFEIEEDGYFFVLTVLPLFLLRAIPYRIGRRKSVGTEALLRTDGGLLGRLSQMIERCLATRIPIGSSLIVIAKRPVN